METTPEKCKMTVAMLFAHLLPLMEMQRHDRITCVKIDIQKKTDESLSQISAYVCVFYITDEGKEWNISKPFYVGKLDYLNDKHYLFIEHLISTGQQLC